jgi:hypothetical protein
MGSFIPHAPDNEITGSIMTAYNEEAEISRGQIVSINRGKAEGLEPGNVLAVFRAGDRIPKIKKPDPRDHIPEVNIATERDADGKLIVNLVKEDPNANSLQLPDERIGLVMVFRTFEYISYALVMQSVRPIYVKDLVKTP